MRRDRLQRPSRAAVRSRPTARGIGQLRRVGRLWRWRWWRCLSPLLAFALPTVAGQAEATCHVVAASPPVVAAERVTQISIWRRSRELHRQASVALAVARPWRDDLRTRDFPAGGRFRRARLPRRRLRQLDVLLDRVELQGVPDASTRRVRRCRSVWQRLPRASHSARDLQGRAVSISMRTMALKGPEPLVACQIERNSASVTTLSRVSTD